MGQFASADVPDIPPSIDPHPYLPLYSTRFIAFRTSRLLYCFPDFASTDFASALLLSELRVRFTAFRTSRPHLLLSRLRVRGLRVHIYCFPDFESTDF
ncbi:hypothetical protein CRG98_010111 [Punica granatum]|uniref:Uncharacterized protein n=1 Tax=Punica granatum TaxID=22663 RepID=A0A2I0KLX4_PUNGR|nr:hypothetical protein CRG98_010111 [Punica granatum]